MLWENAVFGFFMKTKIARKRVILHMSIFYELCLGKCWELMVVFHLLKSRKGIDMFRTEKV